MHFLAFGSPLTLGYSVDHGEFREIGFSIAIAVGIQAQSFVQEHLHGLAQTQPMIFRRLLEQNLQ